MRTFASSEKCPAFANAYITLLEQPDKFSGMTFDERMSVMIDKEYDSRISNRIKCLLKKSGLPNTKASINEIAYLPERQLDQNLINRLGTFDFITKRRNVFVLGATGDGKTFLASAIAADACHAGWSTLYILLPDFFIEYANAAALHKEFEILKKNKKASLLILDEFLLIPADNPQQRILLVFSSVATTGLPKSSARNSVQKAA